MGQLENVMTEDFWYLATPYSKYAEGREMAYAHASQAAARVLQKGIKVFCPIAHTHPMALFGNLPTHDYKLWLGADQPFIDHAEGLLVVMMPGWKESFGVQFEIKEFKRQKKPIIYYTWPGLEIER
jgi:Domain of unknown function (DUF1937)